MWKFPFFKIWVWGVSRYLCVHPKNNNGNVILLTYKHLHARKAIGANKNEEGEGEEN